jgi:hypothetical protein
MTDLFKDTIPSILKTGKRVISSENEGEMNPFIVNKALSFHYDCIMYANQMNMASGLPKKLQYDYLFHSVRKYNRKFQPWSKKEKNAEIELVMEYYKYTYEKARAVLAILSDEEINEIKARCDTGGSDKRKTLKGKVQKR